MKATPNELSEEFIARLDRNGGYRKKALEVAAGRAELHRNIRDDNKEVLGLADAYYDWLKGDGHSNVPGGMSPTKEPRRKETK